MAGTPHVAGTVVNAADLNDRTKVYDRVTTTVDVVSTVADTQLYAKVIGAGHMSSDRMLRLTLLGDYLHNATAGDTISLNFRLGGGAYVMTDSSNLGNSLSATRQAWRLVFEVVNLGSASSQYQSVHAVLGNTAGTASTGIGDISGANSHHGMLGVASLSAVDTTIAQTLQVTAQWSASSASNSFRMRYAVLELL